jgi:hypothetical protein
VAPPGLGEAGECFRLRRWRKQGEGEGWGALTAWQWVTPRGWFNVAGKVARRHRLAALGTTPGELPGLVEVRPDVALAFFRKAAECLRVELREGLPWLSVKVRGPGGAALLRREGRTMSLCLAGGVRALLRSAYPFPSSKSTT